MRELLQQHIWTTEDGQVHLTKDLRPVVDESNGRLYAVTELGSVVLLKEYEPYRKRCARDAAMTFWGEPSGWQPFDEQLVSCQCANCVSPVEDFGSAWRLTSRESGVIMARHILRTDAGVELELDEHEIYESPARILGVDREVEIDSFAAMVERFGEPYDMASGEVNPTYSNLYRTS